MVELQRIKPRWAECIVAATGPSLTEAVAERCRGRAVLAIKDAYRRLPWAAVLYGCDAHWWDAYDGCPDFAGEKWSSHSEGSNEKRATAERWGLRLVRGADGEGFSCDPSLIHYGSNSGFQAINLALLWGARRLVLVGFDMRVDGPRRHFFGSHPPPMNNCLRYEGLVPRFRRAAAQLPRDIEIVNCSPGSALDCWPIVPLEEALA